MKLPVKAKISIEDGIHTGVIIGLNYRDTPYQYTDVVIEFKVGETAMQLKAGYPTSLTQDGKLYMLLERFGCDLQVGKDIDIDPILIGQKCQFMTMTEKTEKGTFANVIPKSVKPVPSKQAVTSVITA